MQVSNAALKSQGHEKTWRCILSIENGLSAMYVYKLQALQYLSQKRTNFLDIIEGRSEIEENEKKTFPPGDWIDISGTKVSLSLLIWITVQNYIQASRNCFDYFAQIIIDYFPTLTKQSRIDFGAIVKAKSNLKNEKVYDWIESIEQSALFQYINDFSNLVKHNHDMPTSISIRTSDLKMVSYIPDFKKDDRSYSRSELETKMNEIYDFTVRAYNQLLLLVIDPSASHPN